MTFNAGIEAAAKAIDDLRTSEAASFNDSKYAGQRGCDRSNALQDAYHKVKALTRPSSSAPVERREAVAQALLDRFNQRSKRRTIGGSQPFPDGTKVSSLPASYRDDFYADADAVILSLPGSSRDEVLEEAAKVAECAGCGDPKCSSCYGNQIASAIRALKSGVAK